MNQIVAGIVIYKPDFSALKDLIASVAQEVSAIIVVSNSAISLAEFNQLQAKAKRTPVYLDDPGKNIGLGGAYERIMARIDSNDMPFETIKRVILFDQDSSPATGMVSALAARMDTLQKLGECPALIGSKPAAISPEHKSPTIHPHSSGRKIENSQAVWFAISSGSLIDIDVFRQIGSFRSDFFIDAIDIEWCFRAWSAGNSCWIADDILMPHRLGNGQITVPLLGWKLPVQSPLRLGTYARNQAALLRINHVPRHWKIRVCLYLLMQTFAYWLADHGKTERPRSLIKGFAAGLAGRLGPPKNVMSEEPRINPSAIERRDVLIESEQAN